MMDEVPEGWIEKLKIAVAVFILVFWVVAPLAATRFGYSSMDVSFWITMVYAVIFGAWKLSNRFDLFN